MCVCGGGVTGGSGGGWIHDICISFLKKDLSQFDD